ncbi:hypothetical protein ATANTOWER_010154, partial [Ataeniobius toweri]|nr:hypothetical protein [Ataeniobius toweri]
LLAATEQDEDVKQCCHDQERFLHEWRPGQTSPSATSSQLNKQPQIKIFYLPSCCLSVCILGSSATQASSKEHVYCR